MSDVATRWLVAMLVYALYCAAIFALPASVSARPAPCPAPEPSVIQVARLCRVEATEWSVKVNAENVEAAMAAAVATAGPGYINSVSCWDERVNEVQRKVSE